MPVENDTRASFAPLTDQRPSLFDAEASTDFIAEMAALIVEFGANEIDNRSGQNNSLVGQRLLAARQYLLCQFDKRINVFPGQSTGFAAAKPPGILRKPPTSGPTATAEMPMQRVDQDRQIGLAGVARPDEHRQRAQIDLGFDDRPEIRHFELENVWPRHFAHILTPRFKPTWSGIRFRPARHYVAVPHPGAPARSNRRFRLNWMAVWSKGGSRSSSAPLT